MKRTFGLNWLTPLCFLVQLHCGQDMNNGPSTSGPTTTTPDMGSGGGGGGGGNDGGGGDKPPPNVGPIPTQFIALRVGDGTATLSADAAAVFLERRNIADGSLVGTATALPTYGTGANASFSLSGTDVTEGALTLSGDGHSVLCAGFNAAPGSSGILNNSQRVIAVMNAAGTVDTTTVWTPKLTVLNDAVRSAASTDGHSLWVSQVSGIGYTTLGSTNTPVSLASNEMRVLGLYNGQLYVSRSSNTAGGIDSVGQGTPMAMNTATKQLPGFASMNNTLSPFGFLALDLHGTGSMDTLYVADDRPSANGGGVQRYTLTGGNWQLDGTMSTGLTSGARGLTGYWDGTKVTLLATTSEAGGAPTRVVSFVDPGGAVSGIMPTVLANSPAKMAYRGIALAPTM